MPLLDPSIIATGIKPPDITDPAIIAETANRAALLRQQVAEGPLRAQALANQVQNSGTQGQEFQLNLQKAQEDQADQQTIQDSMARFQKPDGTTDWNGFQADVQPQIKPRNWKPIQDYQQAYIKQQLELPKIQQENNALRNTALANAGQSLLSLPAEQRAGAYPGLRQTLLDQKFIGENDPDYPAQPGDLSDTTLRSHLAHVGALAAWDKDVDAQAQAKERLGIEKKYAAGNDAYALQQKKENAAAEHLGVTNQEQHSEWLENLDPAVKPFFQNFQTFDPSTPQGQATAAKIQEVPLNSNQRTSRDVQKQRADAMTQRAGTTPGALAVLASDPTQTPEVRQSAANALALQQKAKGTSGASANQQMIQSRDDERQAQLQKTLQGQEAQLWQLKAQYKNRIQKASADGQDTIKDPKTNRDMPIDDATTLMNGIDQRAQILNNQQDEILKRHGWGKYTPAIQSPSQAPAGTPAATSQAPPASVLKEGVATKFKNGQTWTLQGGKQVRLDQPGQ